MSKRKRYVEAAVFRILNELNGVGSGGRNVALNHAAFGLGQFVGAGALDYSDAAMALDSAAASLGISKAEAANTIKSGLRSGSNKPRELPNDDDRSEVRIPAIATAPRPIYQVQPPPKLLQGLLQVAWDARGAWEPHHHASPDLRRFMDQRRLSWPDLVNFGCFELLPPEQLLIQEHIDVLREEGATAQLEELGWVGEHGVWLGFQEPGLLVPIWSSAWMRAPVAYRWRPWAAFRRVKRKTWAMPGSQPWRQLPLWRRGPWDQIHDVWEQVCRDMEQLGLEEPKREDHGPRDERIAVIVEGEPDFLTLHEPLSQLGVTCIGLPGAMWLEPWDALLRDMKRVIIATDADKAGEDVARKIGLACEALSVRYSRVEPQDKDWSDVVSLQKATATEVAVYLKGRAYE